MTLPAKKIHEITNTVLNCTDETDLMSLPYFFVPGIDGNLVDLPEETARHCVQVLRMRPGEQLSLTDGIGHLYDATIRSAGKRHCTVSVDGVQMEERVARKVSIAISPLKNAGRFEWFLEKATEIGVVEIVPLICQRTERQHFKAERAKSILISAMLQSKQSWLPVLKEPVAFEQAVAQSGWTQKLIAHCEDIQKTALSHFYNSNDTQILIGPEGDFTQTEIDAARFYGYHEVSLGLTRLRTETAGIVAATLLINHD